MTLHQNSRCVNSSRCFPPNPAESIGITKFPAGDLVERQNRIAAPGVQVACREQRHGCICSHSQKICDNTIALAVAPRGRATGAGQYSTKAFLKPLALGLMSLCRSPVAWNVPSLISDLRSCAKAT
jgi:hypothetical protein